MKYIGPVYRRQIQSRLCSLSTGISWVIGWRGEEGGEEPPPLPPRLDGSVSHYAKATSFWSPCFSMTHTISLTVIILEGVTCRQFCNIKLRRIYLQEVLVYCTFMKLSSSTDDILAKFIWNYGTEFYCILWSIQLVDLWIRICIRIWIHINYDKKTQKKKIKK
jgi:hypothetical protein